MKNENGNEETKLIDKQIARFESFDTLERKVVFLFFNIQNLLKIIKTSE